MKSESSLLRAIMQVTELIVTGPRGDPVSTRRRLAVIGQREDLIVEALAVRTLAELDHLWERLGELGADHIRPIGDRWGNRGLFTAAGGNSDHKLIELVTNMHDSVILTEVQRRFPDTDVDSFCTLFASPAVAVASLFDGVPNTSLAEKCEVEIHDSGGRTAEDRRHRTLLFRDHGIGMTASDVADSLFHLGSSRKDGVLWQLGAFGRGGLTVLPSCYGWVVVTRRQPDLGAGVPDEIVVTAVRWQRIGNRQTETAVYRVMEDWPTGDRSLPLSIPANDATTFDPGTRLAVVAFQAEGIWVSRLGDERSLDTVLDTRLFEPTLPTILRAPVFGDRGNRATVLRGLARRLEDNPRQDRQEGREVLPFRRGDRTYLLPIRFFVFPSGDVGTRRRFVARDHALVLNSNGQVHAHWTPAEFRGRTQLGKLADRILVAVDTDHLPLPLRTMLFTADRTELLRNDDSVRLEEELISFLNDWDALRMINNDLIRASIMRSNVGRSTLAVATRIGRALQLRSALPARAANSRTQSNRRRTSVELLDDPTKLVGPTNVSVVRGRTKGIYFTINGPDGFVPRQTTPKIDCTHLDIDPGTDITVGELKDGHLRIAVAVPPDAEVTECDLELVVEGWLASTGGLGPRLSWTTKLNVIDEQTPVAPVAETTTSNDSGSAVSSSAPSRVALLWSTDELEDDWTNSTVGVVEYMPASLLAEVDSEYSSLKSLESDIPVLKLNETYPPLRAYSALRSREMGDEGVARAKDRYALGVGVELFLLEQAAIRLAKLGDPPSEEWRQAAAVAAARGVLSVLPDFDQLVAETGLEDL